MQIFICILLDYQKRKENYNILNFRKKKIHIKTKNNIKLQFCLLNV